jgi:hypothetical protein
MDVLLQGQLAVAAERHSIEYPITEQTQLDQCIRDIAGELTAEAKALLLNHDDSIRVSLFVALDGEHQRDFGIPIPPNTKELMLMPPMAGG